MKKFNSILPLMLVGTSLLVVACGDSSESATQVTQATPETTTPEQSPAVTLPELISGSVTDRVGTTVTINGYTFDIDNVPVGYADVSLNTSALIENMQVSVKTNGVKPTSITLNPDISGSVTAVSEGLVQVNTLNVNVAGIATTPRVGDYVAITTDPLNTDTYVASAVLVMEGNEVPVSIELEGAVQQLDASQQRFVLSGITVDYSTAQFTPANLSNGLWVEVYGELSGQQMIAWSIETERFDGVSEAEIEGVITWVDSQKQRFELNNDLMLEVLATTKFEDGSAQNLVIGRSVEVNVRVTATGFELVEVEFNDQGETPPNGDTVANTFSVIGQVQTTADGVVLNGYSFYFLPTTEFDDGLTRSNIQDQKVEMEGVVRNGQFQVLEVERADNDLRVDLEGMVTQNSLWGYSAEDKSLAAYEGKWVDVECDLYGQRLSACRLDD